MENQTLETQEEIKDVIVELEKQKKTKSISDKIDLLKIKLKQIISKSEQKKRGQKELLKFLDNYYNIYGHATQEEVDKYNLW